jgi:hypothetical protein
MGVRDFYERLVRSKAPNRGKPPLGDGLLDGAEWDELTTNEKSSIEELFLRIARIYKVQWVNPVC